MGRQCCRCIGLVIVIICLAEEVTRGLGKVYIVGDSGGWAMGVDYVTWSSSKTFHIGDTLVFKYEGGHTVDEVNERDYKRCRVENPNYPINTNKKGTTTIILQTQGPHYFICGLTNHCQTGMKLCINVNHSASNISAANYSASSFTSPTDIYPTATTTTAMIPDSASPSSSGGSNPSSRGELFILCVALLIIILF